MDDKHFVKVIHRIDNMFYDSEAYKNLPPSHIAVMNL